MILSGFETQQNYHLNYMNLLYDSHNLHYNLSNRVDSDGNILQWGESVLIGVDNTRGTPLVSLTDINIFDLTDTIQWSVYNVSDHWILISNTSTDGLVNFSDYYNSKKPNSEDHYKVKQNSIIRHIRHTEQSKNYSTLNVEMKALDTINQGIKFDNMKMKVDLNGGIIVYDLSISFFIELQNKNIEGTLFDLCIQSDEYKPIIRGLKFEEKVRDLDYLIFSHYTNNGKQYIIFTTKSVLSNYSVYPDIYITDNLYNNISNDYRIPSLYNNMMNDIYSTELVSLYTNSDSVNELVGSETSYCKEVNENDVIKYLTEAGDTETINLYTVLSSENYSTAVTIHDTLQLISHNDKILLVSNDMNEIKEQYLNNLLLEFNTPTSTISNDYRLLQIYYDDSTARKELLYQCYLPITTIFPNEVKTFRVVI